MKILILVCAFVAAAECAKLPGYVLPSPQGSSVTNGNSNGHATPQAVSGTNGVSLSSGSQSHSSTVNGQASSGVFISVDSDSSEEHLGGATPQTFPVAADQRLPATLPSASFQGQAIDADIPGTPLPASNGQTSSQHFAATLVNSYTLPTGQQDIRVSEQPRFESTPQDQPSFAPQTVTAQTSGDFINEFTGSVSDDTAQLILRSSDESSAETLIGSPAPSFAADAGQALPLETTHSQPQTEQSVFVDTTPLVLGTNGQSVSGFSSSPAQFEVQSSVSSQDDQATQFTDLSTGSVSGSQLVSGQTFTAEQQDFTPSTVIEQTNEGSSALITQVRSGDCPEGQVQHYDGSCVQPEITRNVFLYSAPKPDLKATAEALNLPPPKVEHNIVFIRTPEYANGQEPIIIPPPQLKNVIYVLNKESEFGGQRIIEVTTPKPKNPEVYFVNYAEGDNPTLPDGTDFATALTSAVQGNSRIISGNAGISTNTAVQTDGQINTGNEGIQTNIVVEENLISSDEVNTSFTEGVALPELNTAVVTNFESVTDNNIAGVQSNAVSANGAENAVSGVSTGYSNGNNINRNNGFNRNNGYNGNNGFNGNSNGNNNNNGVSVVLAGSGGNGIFAIRDQANNFNGPSVSEVSSSSSSSSSASTGGVALPSTLYKTP